MVDYLKAQAGAGAKVFIADWDDQSSEWMGSSIVVQTKDPKRFLVANVVTFKM